MTATRSLISISLGALFGLGLTVSGMIQPQKIQDFLDFTDLGGRWDPSLSLVMGGALLITTLTYSRVLRRSRPILSRKFQLPVAQDIDRRLLAGAALFGVGWGLSGFCPGPAIVSLTTGSRPAMIFVAAMLLGMALHRAYQGLRQPHLHP
jgi:uncharacterized membrane protein YedE/YeeE